MKFHAREESSNSTSKQDFHSSYGDAPHSMYHVPSGVNLPKQKRSSGGSAAVGCLAVIGALVVLIFGAIFALILISSTVETDTETSTSNDTGTMSPAPDNLSDIPFGGDEKAKDQYYIEQIREYYPMNELTDEQVVRVGKKACERLDRGESVASLYDEIQNLPLSLMMDTSFAFGAGVGFYCSEHTDEVLDYSQKQLDSAQIPDFTVPDLSSTLPRS